MTADSLTATTKLLEAVAHLLRATAWPLASIVIVIILRAPISHLLVNLRRAKFQDFEVEVSPKLKRLKTDVASRLQARDMSKISAEVQARLQSIEEIVRQLAPVSHRAAAVQIYEQVEQAWDQKAKIGPSPLASGVIDKRSPLDEFREVRDMIIHAQGPEISPEVLTDFAQIARLLILDQAR